MQFLIVPGLGGSGPEHWQSLWELSYPGMMRVEQPDWDSPDRGAWIEQLSLAVHDAPGAILIGHSLGCPLIAHLAEREPELPIAGAMLVAPADVDAEHGVAAQLREFAPVPLARLPFAAVVVASTNDPYVASERARFFANRWGARFVSAGPCRHINVAAGFGPWPAGEKILDELVRECRKKEPSRILANSEYRSH
ncbi:MAG TPA: alpha/beta hydrolase [Xanthobacteraceae bacterium]|nr:alpha/beta hydrolase [Xanthobacteraceae bacterium]